MIERLYILEEADVEQFIGPNRSNLAVLANLFPKIRFRLHANVFKILGEKQNTDDFVATLEQLERFCLEHNYLKEENIIEITKRIEQGESASQEKSYKTIVYGVSGRPITARGKNQERFVSLYRKNPLIFALGPAGSGKTFIAIALAVRALKNKEVRTIILSRPAVEAGEKLGFLPGEMKDKLDPYLQPLYDALGEMIPPVKLKEYIENKVIQIAPLAYMRGRTLNDAVVILDEAQNTTKQQMKMFLTRLGEHSKMIVTGDISQIDLPKGVESGLKHALNLLSDIEGIGVVHFDKEDIVRHKLVAKIVARYDEAEEKENEERR